MRYLVALLLFASPSDDADSPYLYSCRAYTGAITVQAMPCPPTMRETRRVPVGEARSIGDVEDARQRVIDEAKALAEAGLYGRTQGSSKPRPWDPPAGQMPTCAWIKSARDRYFKSIGLARNYQVLSGWQEAVYEACKHVRPGTPGF